MKINTLILLFAFIMLRCGLVQSQNQQASKNAYFTYNKSDKTFSCQGDCQNSKPDLELFKSLPDSMQTSIGNYFCSTEYGNATEILKTTLSNDIVALLRSEGDVASVQQPNGASANYLKLRENIKSYVEANSFNFDAVIEEIDKENEELEKQIEEERKKQDEERKKIEELTKGNDPRRIDLINALKNYVKAGGNLSDLPSWDKLRTTFHIKPEDLE